MPQHTNIVVNASVNQEYNGVVSEIVGFDDIQGNAGGGTLHPTSTPTWTDHAYGIGSGVAFRALGFAPTQIQYYTMQTPHAMKLNTVLEQHFHFCTAGDGTGTRFQFQLDVIAAGVGGTWAKPASSPFTAEEIMTADLSGTHSLLELGDIEAANTTVSSLYKMKLTRIAATQDEYSGLVFVEFFDGHFQQDQVRGSVSEYDKYA